LQSIDIKEADIIKTHYVDEWHCKAIATLSSHLVIAAKCKSLSANLV